MEQYEFRTCFTRYNGAEYEYSSMYSYVLQEHKDSKTDHSPFDRKISFSIGQGDLTPAETKPVTASSDYAYVIDVLAERNYREATGEDWDSSIGNTASLICYIENLDGTVDRFWCDAGLYVLHQVGDGLQDAHFTDISTEPLAEEEYAHLHVIAASYLYSKRDFSMYPFRYDSIGEKASSAISIKIIYDGWEDILDDEMTDDLVEAARTADIANTGEKSLYSCILNENIDFEKMVHFLVIDKNEHTW